MNNFVTYLVTYMGDLLPRYYIGSSSKDKVISGNYFGSISSKKWKKIFLQEKKNNKHLFHIEILSEHSSRKEALDEELRLQILNDVVISDNYMNESYAKVNGYFGRDISGYNHPQYGKKISDETKEKISNSLKGHIETEITRRKKSESKKGSKNSFFGKKHSIDSINKISENRSGIDSWNKGVPMSEETKIKLSKTKTGIKMSDETKKKLSDMRKGKPKSEEHKRKLKEAWVKRKRKKDK